MVEGVVEELARKRLGRTIKGKWRLDRLIGVGGMAAVYSATHRNGARVAIKMLHPTISASQQVRARFVREGYLANKVDHPGVVRILDDDIDEHDQSAFLVMDLVIGTTLAERAMDRLLDEGEVLDVADQVLQVLAAAHDKGIVHRDLKPDNLLVDPNGRVHVLDFGIARLLDEGNFTATKTGTAFGTPGFMAPEQAMGRTAQISARTDLYALGATLFALVCGDFVHAAENPQELMVLVATQPARSLADLAPQMHPDVCALIDKSTRNRPEDRWASAAEMLDAVRALRDKLGVASVKVLPLDNPNRQAPPAVRQTPNALSHPTPSPEQAMTFPSPQALGDARSGQLDAGSVPLAVASPIDEVLPRKPKFVPLAIVGGGALVIGIVALVLATRAPEGKSSGSGASDPTAIPKVLTRPATSLTVPLPVAASGQAEPPPVVASSAAPPKSKLPPTSKSPAKAGAAHVPLGPSVAKKPVDVGY